MKQFGNNRKKKRFLWGTVIAVFAVIFIFAALYVNDYYHADVEAIEEYAVSDMVETEQSDNDMIVYEPEQVEAGFIFYPGGKVEYTAYEPLMQELASRGIMCVLVKMPFNLAVLDVGAAEGVTDKYPEIEKWYIGGHSLGGSMAASYAENAGGFDGLILLGSYSTADFSTRTEEVLSIYGSEDKVLNQEKYRENKSNLPENFTEIVIEGGSHAYFGMYGEQDGDGTPTITNEEQIEQTADAIAAFIGVEE